MHQSEPQYHKNFFPSMADQRIESSLITKIALIVTLISIFLIPWGNAIFDGFTRLFGIAGFGLAAIGMLLDGTHRQYSFFHLFILMFGCWITLSLMWSPLQEKGIDDTITFIQLVFLAFLFTFLLDTKDKKYLAYQSYVLGVFVASLIIVYNFINGIESAYYGRYGIVNYEVDGLAISLAFAIPMAAFLATQYKSKLIKAINVVSIPVSIFAIFLTATRTAAIAAMVALVYWLYTQRKADIKIKVLLFVLIVGSIFGGLAVAPKASVDRIFSSSKSISSGTLNYRTVIWGASIKQWQKTPIVGSGVGGLIYVLNESYVLFSSAHNTFIQVLTEMGIVGLLLYLLILLSIVYYILKSPEDKVFLLFLLLVSLTTQLTMNTLYDKETWFLLTMLAIHAYSRYDKHAKL